MIQFSDEEVCKDWYQQLQKQIRLQSAASISDLAGTGNAINGSSSSSSLTTTSPPSGSSNSSISSPQSSTSVSSPPIIGKPPVGLGKPPHPPTPPPVPPLPQHRTYAAGTPSRQALLQSSASNAVLLKRGSYWADKILTAHTPHRPESSSGSQNTGTLDQNEDIQLLNVIDAYYRKIPGPGKDLASGKTRKLSNTSKCLNKKVLYINLNIFRHARFGIGARRFKAAVSRSF